MGWADSKPDWDRFISMLSPGAGEKILDIGAGNGDVASKVLGSGGGDVYAVEPNEKKVASMKAAHPAVKSSFARAEKLPFPDSTFDKAYTTMALHHYEDIDRALQETARVLRPGGLFVVLEANPSSGLGRIFRFFGRLTGERMSLMTKERLEERVCRAGMFRTTASADAGSAYLVLFKRA